MIIVKPDEWLVNFSNIDWVILEEPTDPRIISKFFKKTLDKDGLSKVLSRWYSDGREISYTSFSFSSDKYVLLHPDERESDYRIHHGMGPSWLVLLDGEEAKKLMNEIKKYITRKTSILEALESR